MMTLVALFEFTRILCRNVHGIYRRDTGHGRYCLTWRSKSMVAWSSFVLKRCFRRNFCTLCTLSWQLKLSSGIRCRNLCKKLIKGSSSIELFSVYRILSIIVDKLLESWPYIELTILNVQFCKRWRNVKVCMGVYREVLPLNSPSLSPLRYYRQTSGIVDMQFNKDTENMPKHI